MPETVVVDTGQSAGAPEGHVDASVSERLEQHAADIARIEAELRAELERLRTDLYQAVSNVPSSSEHSHAEIAALEERIATHEHELEEIADQVDEAVVEDPPPADPPPPDTPPERPHFLHKKLF